MVDLMYKPGIKNYTTKIGSEIRTYTVEVPVGFNPETGIVMFFFKGKGGAQTSALVKRFSKYLQKHNCIGVYPDAAKRTKKASEWAVEGDDFKKDQAFFEDLQHTYINLPIFFSGVSNGGCFALRLVQTGYNYYATVTFAASSWHGLIKDNLTVPIYGNVFAIHGKLDTSVPYYGGYEHGLHFLPAEESIKQFIQGDIKTVLPVSMPGKATIRIYTNPDAECKLLSVDESGHDVFSSYKGIDLIDAMMMFFREHI